MVDLNKNIIIGLTGNIATGKTFISQHLENKYKAKIFNADAKVHDLYNNSLELKKTLEQEFNIDLSTENLRVVLSQIIIEKGSEIIDRLEEIIFPLLTKSLKIWLKENKNYNILVIDAPLLLEANWQQFCQKIILMTLDKNIQAQRALMRSNLSQDKFKLLLARQEIFKDKHKYADLILDSANDKTKVLKKLDEFIGNLSA